MKLLKITTISLVCLLTAFSAYAQGKPSKKKKQEGEIEWMPGTLVLSSGKEMSGEIKYEFNNIVLFRKDSVYESFTSKKIDMFEVYEEEGSSRAFYKIPVVDHDEELISNNSYKQHEIMELLKEGYDYALMSKKRRFDEMEYSSDFMTGASYMPGMGNVPLSGYATSRMVTKYSESIYLVMQGGAYNYSRLGAGEKKTKTKIDLRKRLLTQFMRDDFPKVDLYAKNNKLSYLDENQLFEILHYYDLLTAVPE